MKTKPNEQQKSKLKKLNDELRELWETLTPSEQERRIIFYKFFKLQKQIRAIQNRSLNEKEKNVFTN